MTMRLQLLDRLISLVSNSYFYLHGESCNWYEMEHAYCAGTDAEHVLTIKKKEEKGL